MSKQIAPDKTVFVFSGNEYPVIGRVEDMPVGLAKALSKFLRLANSADFKKNPMTQIDSFGYMAEALERFFLHFLGADNGQEAIILLDVMPMSSLPEVLGQMQAIAEL